MVKMAKTKKKKKEKKTTYKRNEKKRLALIIVLLCCIVISTIIFSISAYYNVKPLAVKEVSMDVTVREGKKVGINADTDALHFGILQPVQKGARGINTTNNMDIPVRVQIYVSGNISEWITLSKNDYVLEPGNGEIVDVHLTVPYSGNDGNYTGTLKAVYTKER